MHNVSRSSPSPDMTITSSINLSQVTHITELENLSQMKNITQMEVLTAYSVMMSVDKVVAVTLDVIGITFNPLCAYFWLDGRIRTKNSSAIYLGLLSLTHFVFLVLELMADVNYGYDVQLYEQFCGLYTMLLYIPQYLAPLLVLSFTTERFLVVCFPFCSWSPSPKNTIRVVTSLLLLCILTSSPQLYMWVYDEKNKVCNVRDSTRVHKFIKIWTWISEIVYFGVVHLCILAVNILFITSIRKMSKKSAAHTISEGGRESMVRTKTLITVSLFLITTQLPFTLMYGLNSSSLFSELNKTMTLEEVKDDPTWQTYVTFIDVFFVLKDIQLTNYAFYVIIYLVSSRYFRLRFKRFFCSCCFIKGSQSSSWLKDISDFDVPGVIPANV